MGWEELIMGGWIKSFYGNTWEQDLCNHHWKSFPMFSLTWHTWGFIILLWHLLKVRQADLFVISHQGTIKHIHFFEMGVSVRGCICFMHWEIKMCRIWWTYLLRGLFVARCYHNFQGFFLESVPRTIGKIFYGYSWGRTKKCFLYFGPRVLTRRGP